jgi:translation initiation factor IF-1
MLFGETVAVYCENHMEHINTLCGQNAETLYIRIQFVPDRKHYVSATETNRLMLLGETVAVYCENHGEHINTVCGQNTEFWYVKAGGTYSDHSALGDEVMSLIYVFVSSDFVFSGVPNNSSCISQPTFAC